MGSREEELGGSSCAWPEPTWDLKELGRGYPLTILSRISWGRPGDNRRKLFFISIRPGAVTGPGLFFFDIP